MLDFGRESHQDLSIPCLGCDRTSLRFLASTQRLPSIESLRVSRQSPFKAWLETDSCSAIGSPKAAKHSSMVAFTRDSGCIHRCKTNGGVFGLVFPYPPICDNVMDHISLEGATVLDCALASPFATVPLSPS